MRPSSVRVSRWWKKAQLPEDTKKMVLAYAQGVASGKKLARAGA